MTNREIYTLALRLIAETGEGEDTADYEERAGYLLSAYCSEVHDLAKKLCLAQGLPFTDDDPLYRPLDQVFPYPTVLAGPGAYYLAAMLILDEDPDLSDNLFGKYCDVITRILSGLPMQNEQIIDRYGFV